MSYQYGVENWVDLVPVGRTSGLSLFNLKKLQENQDLISWRETHSMGGW